MFTPNSTFYQLPCLLGRENKLTVKMHLLKESNNKLSINIPVKRGNILDEELKELIKVNSVKYKLVLADCKEM